MRRWFSRAALLIAAAAIVSACGGNNSSTSTTTPSTVQTVLTETFSGTLSKNAAYTHTFAVTEAGNVSVFLTQSVDPANPDNNTIPIGVSLGTWNGTACTIVIANDNISPGASIIGQATAAGNLCVRVYDVGFVPGAANYELLIDHY